MAFAELEHANITVTNQAKTAEWMDKVFGWKIRWEGKSMTNGYSTHVGSENTYLALYSPAETPAATGEDTYATAGGLNHLCVVVDDIEATEKRVIEAGFTPQNHADYEPGQRFYFYATDGVEYEVVSYSG